MAVIEQAATETIETVDTIEQGWFADPVGLHKLRYFDGDDWTDHVTHFGPTPCQGCAHRGDGNPTN